MSFFRFAKRGGVAAPAVMAFAVMAFVAVGLAHAEERAGAPSSFIADEDRLKTAIDRVVIGDGVPSISVAAAKGDSDIWAYASGLADKEAGRAATPSTPYRLASVSKPITAVAVMQLADRGVIDLDAPANDYLGAQKIVAAVGDVKDVTVRRLMSHRGGLPLHYNLIHEGEPERRSLDETIARYGKVMLRPDRTHRYSNIGYGVLERIIEVQSGKSYAAFLRDAFFEPLGMGSAGVVSASAHPDGAAIPYTRAGDRYRAYDMDTRGAGGVFMTAADIVRFGRFFSDALDGRSPILSQAAAREMLEAQAPLEEGDPEWYVLGWVHELRGENREHDTIYHLGSTPGVRAEMWIYPDEDLVIATLVNEMNYRTLNRAREAVVASVLPEIAFIPLPEVRLAPALQREWRGAVDLGPEGSVSISLDLRDPAAPVAVLGDDVLAVTSARSIQDGFVQIDTEPARLPTGDARRQPHTLGFVLEPLEDRLVGYVAANRIATRDRDSGNFSYPVALKARRRGD